MHPLSFTRGVYSKTFRAHHDHFTYIGLALDMRQFYPIGIPGEPWSTNEVQTWLSQRQRQRSYAEDVVSMLNGLPDQLSVAQYGALSYDSNRYPLLVVQNAQPIKNAPWVLITGGVHGYETSGVHGALEFLQEHWAHYATRANFVVAPCISPWGYEVINRWNPQAIDPNRSFLPNSPSEEAQALMDMVSSLGVEFLMHIDLHETTDTDESEFRPALAARDGVEFRPGTIPDGFYLVGDEENPQLEFQAAIVSEVKKMTHIAPADNQQEIIRSKVVKPGVILYPYKKLGLCGGLTRAKYTSTTEVYPDSPNVTPKICSSAQVSAICAGLNYALSS